MNEPGASYALLGAGGEPLSEWDADREYYAASTVKLAVAAALMFAVEAGAVRLDRTVASRRRFASRIAGAADFTFDDEEGDPGLPEDGTSVTLGWCLDRMITVSSNETTNLIVEALGASSGAIDGPPRDGVRGLELVREACERLGVPGVRMTRLICDYAAKEAGFTHAVSARDLARLMWTVTCGDALARPSREHLLALLRAQRFPIIATSLPADAVWASKSGWDDGIRHDVALIGEPGSSDCRVFAICTEGFTPHGAQQLIEVLTRGVLRAER